MCVCVKTPTGVAFKKFSRQNMFQISAAGFFYFLFFKEKGKGREENGEGERKKTEDVKKYIIRAL